MREGGTRVLEFEGEAGDFGRKREGTVVYAGARAIMRHRG
jgi:hypothetical protein